MCKASKHLSTVLLSFVVMVSIVAHKMQQISMIKAGAAGSQLVMLETGFVKSFASLQTLHHGGGGMAYLADAATGATTWVAQHADVALLTKDGKQWIKHRNGEEVLHSEAKKDMAHKYEAMDVGRPSEENNIKVFRARLPPAGNFLVWQVRDLQDGREFL